MDVHVSESGKYTPNKRICYEVFLIIFDEYYGTSWSTKQIDEVKEYVNTLAKYMGINICGIYHEVVNEQEWEEMKLPDFNSIFYEKKCYFWNMPYNIIITILLVFISFGCENEPILDCRNRH